MKICSSAVSEIEWINSVNVTVTTQKRYLTDFFANYHRLGHCMVFAFFSPLHIVQEFTGMSFGKNRKVYFKIKKPKPPYNGAEQYILTYAVKSDNSDSNYTLSLSQVLQWQLIRKASVKVHSL